MEREEFQSPEIPEKKNQERQICLIAERCVFVSQFLRARDLSDSRRLVWSDIGGFLVPAVFRVSHFCLFISLRLRLYRCCLDHVSFNDIHRLFGRFFLVLCLSFLPLYLSASASVRFSLYNDRML